MDGATTAAGLAETEGITLDDSTRPVVAVQGLGFVGAAMAIAVASAAGDDGPLYTVLGVDLDDAAGRARIDALNSGRFPFETTDGDLVDALGAARATGNLVACADPSAYSLASVVVVDVPLDIDWRSETPALRLGGFEAAIRTVGRHIRPGTLVLVETTVPPGTTEKIVVPLLTEELIARGLDPESVLVAHSYERVMPGADYYASIVNYWRVFAGHTDAAAKAAEAFLATIINTFDFPLTRLGNTTASETAKVMENTFRATTIALMEEWGRFAETVGVDLFEVVDAIRMRPTHANMRTPGFGVGGYCLTKDPLFAKLAASQLWDTPMEFPFSSAAVRTNDDAPLVTLDRVRRLIGGTLAGSRLLLLGVSYRQDVGDTRYSPSETFVRAALDAGAEVVAHDPLVAHWDELDRAVEADIPDPAGFDAVVFAVPHDEYRRIDLASWLGDARPAIFDGFAVLSADQRRLVASLGCPIASIGRGGEDL
ncbi:MAG: nucleotide sugar dehydrogenase [Acidimicrobiales bacterium]